MKDSFGGFSLRILSLGFFEGFLCDRRRIFREDQWTTYFQRFLCKDSRCGFFSKDSVKDYCMDSFENSKIILNDSCEGFFCRILVRDYCKRFFRKYMCQV